MTKMKFTFPKMNKTLIVAASISTFAVPSFAEESLGVPSCDKFMTQYETCVHSKVPTDQKAVVEQSLQSMRTQFKTMATNPQTKAALGPACEQMASSVKQSMSAYGCKFE